MELRKLLSDGMHLFSGKLGTVVVGLVSLMILSRVLTTEEMGSYQLGLMVVNLALILGLNWFDTSIIRHGREEFVKSKRINLSFWARTVLYVPILGVLIIIFIAFQKPITAYVGIDSDAIWLFIIMFVLNGLLNTVRNIYQSIREMKKSAYILFWQKLILGIALVFVFFEVFSMDVMLLLILVNVSFFLSIIISMIGFPTRMLLPFKYDQEYLKRIWTYSWPQLIGFSGLYVINYIDLYFIRTFLTLHDVGVYSVAYNGFLIISGFIMLIHSLVMPMVVEYRTKKNYKMIRDYVKQVPIFSIGWLLLVIVGVFASWAVFPLLFSQKYVDAIPSFNILLFVSFIYFVGTCLLPLFNAFDLVIFVQAINIVKSVINIIADYYLVPLVGIDGAAYGTLISYAVGIVLSLWLLYYKRKLILHGQD